MARDSIIVHPIRRRIPGLMDEARHMQAIVSRRALTPWAHAGERVVRLPRRFKRNPPPGFDPVYFGSVGPRD